MAATTIANTCTTAATTAAPVSSEKTVQRTSDSSLSSFRQLSFLDRFLAVWILLAMIIGILLGYYVPSTSRALQTAGSFGAVKVSVPIAVGLLVMMYPILCKVRYETLGSLMKARALWIQVAFSLLVNWIFAPLLMVVSSFLLQF